MSSSSRIFRSLTLTLAILFAACSPDPLPSATPPPESAPPSHFVDVRDSPSADGTASLTASVRVAIDFPNQLAPTYRRHFTGGATPIQRGTLVLELCENPSCVTLAASVVLVEDALLGSGWSEDVSAFDLPAGSWYARIGLDTETSHRLAATYGHDEGFGPFDVLQMTDPTLRPSAGLNPAAGTSRVTLEPGGRASLGEIVLGHIVMDPFAAPPTPERGSLLAASSGADAFRNVIRRMDLQTFEVAEAAALTDTENGAPFDGDICGMVPSDDDGVVYVIAARLAGATITAFDTRSMRFVDGPRLQIPHPALVAGGALNSERVPWPCRGVAVDRDGRRFLYLVSYRGAGNRTRSTPYPLVVAEVTGMTTLGEARVVATYDADEMRFFESDRVLRAVVSDGTSVFVAEPSWSKLTDETTVWTFDILPGGALTDARRRFTAGLAEDTCGATNHWVPAMTKVRWAGDPHLVVGFDEGVHVFDTDGTHLSTLNLASYGRLVTSFATSPDGRRLYALPNCRSAAAKASIERGLGPERAVVDRHAVAVIDLDSAPSAPTLLFEARDLDGDGRADGGVELEYLPLKGHVLQWCPDCTDAVPPTTYIGPEIVAGASSIFLRGSGIQSDEVNVAGLGQAGDIAVFDIDRGHGVHFRGTIPWLDGPDARWGFDLAPESPGRTYADDVSVSALLFVPGP